jgi:hypothetical protein
MNKYQSPLFVSRIGGKEIGKIPLLSSLPANCYDIGTSDFPVFLFLERAASWPRACAFLFLQER